MSSRTKPGSDVPRRRSGARGDGDGHDGFLRDACGNQPCSSRLTESAPVRNYVQAAVIPSRRPVVELGNGVDPPPLPRVKVEALRDRAGLGSSRRDPLSGAPKFHRSSPGRSKRFSHPDWARRLTTPENALGHPAHDPAQERLQLDATTWVDLWRGWLRDDGATYRELVDGLAWRESRLWRYDHYVTEPRLTAPASARPPHPVLKAATAAAARDLPGRLRRAGARVLPRRHATRSARTATANCATRATPWSRSSRSGARRPWQLTPLRGSAGADAAGIGGDRAGSVDLAAR